VLPAVVIFFVLPLLVKLKIHVPVPFFAVNDLCLDGNRVVIARCLNAI
jgi:hypothetical protein